MIECNFDLNLVRLNEIDGIDVNADIEVVLNNNFIKKPKKMYEINKNEAFYYKDDVALFVVKGGNKIEIYPSLNKDEDLICESLLNFPLALALYQKGFSILHASAVEYKDKVILFCGSSHSGKSTLSSFFSIDGGLLVTDDISVLRKDGRNYNILPSYGLQKLSDKFVNGSRTNNLSNRKSLRNRDRSIFTNMKFSNVEKSVDMCFFLNKGNRHSIDKITNKTLISNLLKFSYISSNSSDYLNIMDIANKIEFYNLTIKQGFSNLKSFKEHFDVWLSSMNNHQI